MEEEEKKEEGQKEKHLGVRLSLKVSMSVWPQARLWKLFLLISSRREDICGSLEWFAKSSLQLGIQTRLISVALPTPRPGLRASRATGEVDPRAPFPRGAVGCFVGSL